jgi:outer membrane cobalamin receptor
MEALQLVPGLSFGRDVEDVIGVGVHGNWAEEGKCLFLLNGAQLNENDFGTYAIDQRIPLQHVDRIEVICGPGSVIYGGYAALAVVNIITRTADNGPGAAASIRTGYSNGHTTRTSTTVHGAHRLSAHQDISYVMSNTSGQRSNAMALMPDGTPLSFGDSTQMQSTTLQFGYRYKNLQLSMALMDERSDVSDAPYQVQHRDILIGINQKLALGNKWELSWKIGHADQLPWNYLNISDSERLSSNTTNQRTTVQGLLNYRPTTWLTARIGTQAYHQRSSFTARNENTVFSMNGARSISVNDIALFGEILLQGKWGGITGGYRMEHNDLVSRNAAPRIAYTKIWGRLHTKLMWSKAYKIPTVMNLNYGPADTSVITEFVTTSEAEIGLKLGRTADLTFNVYETRIEHPIVYVFDQQTLDNYINRNASGTQGFDVRFAWERQKFTFLASAGLNRTVPNVDLPEIQLPDSLGRKSQGLPAARATVILAVDLTPSWSIRGRMQWQDAIFSYQNTHPSNTDLTLVKWPSQLVIGTGVVWHPKASERVAIDLGCYNMLDRPQYVLSPFNNGTSPYYLNGREYSFTLTYKFIK